MTFLTNIVKILTNIYFSKLHQNKMSFLMIKPSHNLEPVL